MKPEDLIAALGRGMMEAALAYNPPSQKTPVRRTKRTKKVSPPVMEGRPISPQMEMPFEPGVAVAPPITAEQFAEMEAVLQGKRGPLAGHYNPDEPGETGPPWMS